MFYPNLFRGFQCKITKSYSSPSFCSSSPYPIYCVVIILFSISILSQQTRAQRMTSNKKTQLDIKSLRIALSEAQTMCSHEIAHFIIQTLKKHQGEGQMISYHEKLILISNHFGTTTLSVGGVLWVSSYKKGHLLIEIRSDHPTCSPKHNSHKRA